MSHCPCGACPPGRGGGGGALSLFFGRGVRPGLRHPNPGLNQKFANVYPGLNQISVSIHYMIYAAANCIEIINKFQRIQLIISNF